MTRLAVDRAYLTSTAAAEQIDFDLLAQVAEGFAIMAINVSDALAYSVRDGDCRHPRACAAHSVSRANSGDTIDHGDFWLVPSWHARQRRLCARAQPNPRVKCQGQQSGACGGGLYVADEVQSGFGRTGAHFWGSEADGVVPDTVVMAKGLGSGFSIGGVLAKKHIAEPMAEKCVFHTYGANPASAAAARPVLAVKHDEGFQKSPHCWG